MYDPKLVQPMRDELTSIGFTEFKTPEQVDAELADLQGTALVVVNSVCGCAAGGARPGVAVALQNGLRPQKLYTVFAGQDKEATDRVRSYFHGYPPSSPSIALLKDGEVVYMMERRNIEGRSAQQIGGDLVQALEQHCR
jgi:putative YphP/YqiW family bacilliredoxin